MHWFLGTYLGISAVSAAVSYYSLSSMDKNLKAAGYEEVKKGNFWSSVKGQIFLLTFSLIPLLHIIVPLSSVYDAAKGKDGKMYNQMIEEGKYKKTEERLKFEEEELLKKDRFRKAKDSFCGKVSNYEEMTDVQKIELLSKKTKELEENGSIVNNSDEYDAYESLSTEEKIEFLIQEKSKILASHNELGQNFTAAKTKKKKFK